MIIVDILSLFLRLCELIFSIIVAGLTGSWLRANRHGLASSHKRFIYTEIIAALAILFSLIFLLPFAGSFIHWPIDFLLFVATMVAFGLLASYVGSSCGSIWYSRAANHGTGCGRFKADVSFLFLLSIAFLASALLGLYYVHKHRKNRVVDKQGGAGAGGNRWYRNRK